MLCLKYARQYVTIRFLVIEWNLLADKRIIFSTFFPLLSHFAGKGSVSFIFFKLSLFSFVCYWTIKGFDNFWLRSSGPFHTSCYGLEV